MTTDHRVTAFTSVSAPLDEVWGSLCNTSRYDEWVESTIHVVSSEGAARLGSIYEERTRLSGFWTASTRWEVVEFTPPHHLTFDGSGISAVSSIRIAFDVRETDSGTEVSSTYSYSMRFGLVGSLIEFGFKNNVTAEQRRSLRTFAILVESGALGRDP